MKLARLAATAAALAALCVAGCGRQPAAAPDCAALGADLEPLLDIGWTDVGAADGMAESLLGIRQLIERQLVTHDQWVALGWCAFRVERFDTAAAAFDEALQRARHSVDAAIGLGHVALRRGDPETAINWFSESLARDRRSKDAIDGLVLAVEYLPARSPAAAIARAAADAALQDRPDDSTLLLTKLTADRKAGGSGELRRRVDAAAERPAYFARAGNDFLEVRRADGDWQPVFIKGVNIGPALPGHFASEAPQDQATWSAWLTGIAALGANAIRVYTLQPPAFYQALAAHNARLPQDQPGATGHLWLLQGVWADLPPDADFDDPAYLRDLHRNIAQVVDAVHGDLVLSLARGHAQGVYDADVSPHTLAWIIGREWEPYAVAGYNRQHPGQCRHPGRLVQVDAGNAMECWIGATLDFAAGYEARRYGKGRPLTFANWPTLDPLHHPTEATFAERDRWRFENEGVPIPERTGTVWNDDEVAVDATRMSGSAAFGPGVFAAYHVYPNFPYFMNLEPAFAEANDAAGVNRYAGYLRALKRHHGRQPVLIAEFGMSTSRGIAHLQPEGLHHGGLHEPDAMRQTARLARTIHDESMAGGVVFEFIDEWFKGTWTTNPFEVPEEQRPFWFNAESPEQSYGLWAARPQAPVRLFGELEDWATMAPLASIAATDPAGGWLGLRQVRAAQDAGYLYLLLETAGRGPVDWTRTAFTIGLDTYAPERGERRLPAPAECATATGVEFAVVLAGPDGSAVQVTPSYRKRHPWEPDATGILVSPLEPAGRFELPVLTTNHLRYTRSGDRIPEQSVTPGQLRFGSLDPTAADFDTRTDVVVSPGQGIIELRLPWGLLNFGDPAAGRVLHQPVAAEHLDTTATEGIRIYVCAADPTTPGSTSALPQSGEPGAFFDLVPWVMPAYRLEPKHGLEEFARTFRALPDRPAGDGEPTRRPAPGTGSPRAPRSGTHSTRTLSP